MNRFIAAGLLVVGSTVGFVGCEEKTEVQKTTEITTPDGSKTITDKQTVEATGDAKGGAVVTPPTTELPK